MTDRAQWLESRRKGLGGSDIASILGLSPWGSPFDVWVDKVTPAAEMPDIDQPHQKRGRLLERAVGEWMADELERTLTPAAMIVHPVHEWARGTPDGWLTSPCQPDDGAEMKTARELGDSWGADRGDQFPAYYRSQCLWYALISGAPRWHLGVFCTLSEEWRLYTIERDDNLDIMDAMLNRAGEWWERHVIGGTPPPLDLSRGASRWLRHKHAKHSGRLRHAESSDALLIDAWQHAKTMESHAAQMRAAVEVQLKARIAGDAGLIGDFGRVKWSRFDVERLDMARVRQDLPDIVTALKSGGYVKTTEQGRLTLTPPKKGQK